ncbi:MAG: hypothetical protein ABSG90_03355 [Dehalococcoidia bacterium]|jgi:hypothetical protein
MDLITGFYNNLFTIEIAVFGIIAAAIFVFLQIVFSQFSYREVYAIFNNVFLILFLIVSAITLLLTAGGSLLLSFHELNPTRVGNVVLRDIFLNWMTAVALLFSFFLALVLFAVFTLSNINCIRPSRVALLIYKRVRKDQIRDYLLNKYGITSPDRWLFLSRPMDFVIVRPVGIDAEPKQGLSGEEQAQIESQNKLVEKQLSDNTKLYDKIKKTVEHAQDPIEPLNALMLRAINNVDLGTISEAQSVLVNMSADFIENCENNKDSEKWSPYSGIGRKYLEYITDLFRVHLSMCDREKLDSVTLMILETSETISKQVLSANFGGLDIILTFWKEVADNAIGKSREIFNKIMHLYRNLVDYAFEKGIEDNKNCLDEIFRHLGWLGERLISRHGIEKKPLMRNHGYYNEYDELFDILMASSHLYNSKYPASYPLIYFDFVHVIFLQLVSVAKTTQSQKLKENIFSCLYVYSSFAEAALPKRNSNGAALAASRLKDCYDVLVSEGLEESAKEAIDLLVIIGAMAFHHKANLQKVEFIKGGLIDQYIMDIIVTSAFRDTINRAISEAYLHLYTDWDFVTQMGRRLETNFGFMFDWTTGELYPEDDPRRR